MAYGSKKINAINDFSINFFSKLYISSIFNLKIKI